MSFSHWASFGLEKLLMKCDDLSTIPSHTIPEGYELVSTPLEEADYASIADCLSAAYGIQHDVWDVPRIPLVFVENKDVKRSFRLIHTAPDGSTIVAGTATLKIMTDTFPGCGYVHWVAVHPLHQKKGLAKILVEAVLRETKDVHGLNASVLHVVDSSIPAINTYEQFGFKPVLIEENNAGRWEAIREAQKQPRK
jgi:GNAT superfamily N-acetyltransferase